MTPEGDLSRWMHQLKTAYTVYFNRRHQVVGHLFQGRFKSGQKKNWSVVGAEQIFERVSEHFQSDLEKIKERSIRNKSGTAVRDYAVLRDHAGLSHDEIAALFHMPSSNSVAQTIRRTKIHDVQTLKVLKHQNKSK